MLFVGGEYDIECDFLEKAFELMFAPTIFNECISTVQWLLADPQSSSQMNEAQYIEVDGEDMGA